MFYIFILFHFGVGEFLLIGDGIICGLCMNMILRIQLRFARFHLLKSQFLVSRIHQTCFFVKWLFTHTQVANGIQEFATVLTQWWHHRVSTGQSCCGTPAILGPGRSPATSSDRSFLGDALPHESPNQQTPAGLDGRRPTEHPAEEGSWSAHSGFDTDDGGNFSPVDRWFDNVWSIINGGFNTFQPSEVVQDFATIHWKCNFRSPTNHGGDPLFGMGSMNFKWLRG